MAAEHEQIDGRSPRQAAASGINARPPAAPLVARQKLREREVELRRWAPTDAIVDAIVESSPGGSARSARLREPSLRTPRLGRASSSSSTSVCRTSSGRSVHRALVEITLAFPTRKWLPAGQPASASSQPANSRSGMIGALLTLARGDHGLNRSDEPIDLAASGAEACSSGVHVPRSHGLSCTRRKSRSLRRRRRSIHGALRLL
jgi:hypothetical protein